MNRIFVLLGLLVASLFALPATASAQEACPEISADGPGVQQIVGQGVYSFYGIPTIIVDQPVIAVIDDGLATQGDTDSFPPSDGQVIGNITSDFFTSPFSYTINLPVRGHGLQNDLDSDDVDEPGVQVFKVALTQNVLNTVPLTGISQGAILDSYYRDTETEEIVQGALLLYAADDQQGFPCGFGEDGVLFTEDDPIVTLPAGFTVANIADGAITFDRSETAQIDIGESPGSATPDFSDQSFTESFGTLIDFLRQRYVFNNFGDYDWDAYYEEYLPRIQEAEDQNDLGLFHLALADLAHEIFDAHVYVGLGAAMSDPTSAASIREGYSRYFGGVGATLVETDDGNVVFVGVQPGSPAEAAGIVPGTVLDSVDGKSVEEAIAEPVRFLTNPGTEEAKRVTTVQYLLKRFPGTPIEVGYTLPDATEPVTATLTAVSDVAAAPQESVMPLEYDIRDGVGYVTWDGFERTGIATHIFADFIKVMNQKQIPGIIIDLRGNGGGSALMEFAVMSYLFSPDAPLDLSIVDDYTFDVATGEFVQKPMTGEFSAAPGSQPYAGDVVVLVDNGCASACEFMSYWLQASGRATIVGQYATEGAGGNTNAVILPGGIQFNYTAGTNIDPTTEMPTFQGVGVQPDVRVAVTQETEQEKLDGGDPVLDAGIVHLRQLAFSRLNPVDAPFAGGTVNSVIPESWKPNAEGTGYTSPDFPVSLTIDSWTTNSEGDLDTLITEINPEVQKLTVATLPSGEWHFYALDDENDGWTVYAAALIDGTRYLATLTGTDDNLATAAVEYILIPALQSFEAAE